MSSVVVDLGYVAVVPRSDRRR